MTKDEKSGWDAAFRVARAALRKWGGSDGYGAKLAAGATEAISTAKAKAEKPKAPAKRKATKK